AFVVGEAPHDLGTHQPGGVAWSETAHERGSVAVIATVMHLELAAVVIEVEERAVDEVDLRVGVLELLREPEREHDVVIVVDGDPLAAGVLGATVAGTGDAAGSLADVPDAWVRNRLDRLLRGVLRAV